MMAGVTIDSLRKVHEARPFRPFTLFIADGRRLHVPHPECLWIPRKAGRTIFVEAEPDAPELVDLLLVASIKFDAVRGRNGRGRR
jgi:hypothetical protein